MSANTNNLNVLCLQETHRGQDDNRLRVPGMKLVAERPHDKYGSAIFVKTGTHVHSTAVHAECDIMYYVLHLTL